MNRIFLILLICVSTLADAQSLYQKLEDIEDKLEEMEFESEMRDIRRIQERNRLIKERNISDNYKHSNKSNPSKEKSTGISNNDICFVIWNSERFVRLNSRQSHLFKVHIVDDNELPLIEVYLPKSIEKEKSKLNKLVKTHIDTIKKTCQ